MFWKASEGNQLLSVSDMSGLVSSLCVRERNCISDISVGHFISCKNVYRY